MSINTSVKIATKPIAHDESNAKVDKSKKKGLHSLISSATAKVNATATSAFTNYVASHSTSSAASAAAAAVSYVIKVEENPITGQKQHVGITPAQELRLGLDSVSAMTLKMGGELPANDPRVLEVHKIGGMLSKLLPASSPWIFQFHVLNNSKTISAFALPGGQIFVTLGLLNNLQNEAQLAALLSHEIGHVIERHSAKQMAKGELGQKLADAVPASKNNTKQPEGMSIPAVLAGVINQLVQLSYSREDESEADLWGLKLMLQVGYDPQALIQLLQMFKGSPGTEGSDILKTHPNPDLRIEHVQAYLKKHPPGNGLNFGSKLQNGVAI